MVFIGGHPSYHKLAGNLGGDGKIGMAGQIEGVRCTGKDVCAPADAYPFPPIRAHGVTSIQVDNRQFVFTAAKRPILTLCQPSHLERNIIPPRQFGCNIEHQVGIAWRRSGPN